MHPLPMMHDSDSEFQGMSAAERTRRLFQIHVVAHQLLFLLNELKGALKVLLQSPKIKSLVRFSRLVLRDGSCRPHIT